MTEIKPVMIVPADSHSIRTTVETVAPQAVETDLLAGKSEVGTSEEQGEKGRSDEIPS